jgi:hypothetical protein
MGVAPDAAMNSGDAPLGGAATLVNR